MATRAKCSCGWQLELSEFYAGKQLRCPQCEQIVDVPGESTTPLYGSSRPAPRAVPGNWRPVRYSYCARGRCGGGLYVVIMCVVVFAAMLNQCNRDESPAPDVKPVERPSSPSPSSPKEEDF